MTDQQTNVLYVLTTLAQSCAALAAFVGAVGVFRIQMLREQRQGAEKVLRGRTHEASIFRDAAFWVPIDDIAKRLDTVRADLNLKDTDTSNESNPSLGALFAAFKALDVWRVSEVPFKRTRGALLLLEGWNLAVITVALVGFQPRLSTGRGTFVRLRSRVRGRDHCPRSPWVRLGLDTRR